MAGEPGRPGLPGLDGLPGMKGKAAVELLMVIPCTGGNSLTLSVPKNLSCFAWDYVRKESHRQIRPTRNVHSLQLCFSRVCKQDLP